MATRLVVEDPWALIWWEKNLPLLSQDPDIQDRHARYESTPPLDWELVAKSVNEAARQSSGIDDVDLSHVEVTIPWELGGDERDAVEQWLSRSTGSTPRVINIHLPTRHLGDGRHRIWGTQKFASKFVPLRSDNSLTFRIAWPRDAFDVARAVAVNIQNEITWWGKVPAPEFERLNRGYVRGLRTCISRLQEANGFEIPNFD